MPATLPGFFFWPVFYFLWHLFLHRTLVQFVFYEATTIDTPCRTSDGNCIVPTIDPGAKVSDTTGVQ